MEPEMDRLEALANVVVKVIAVGSVGGLFLGVILAALLEAV